jgi:uncharacterized protein YecE (DUF72 family)
MTPKSTCRLQVGTSGYSYPEWATAGVYAPGTRQADMLGAYARMFDVVELNYTWYQMPKPAATTRMSARAPAGFGFAAKLTRTLTHEVNRQQWQQEAAHYREGIIPFLQAGQMVAVLAQFPPGFDRSRGNRLYLARLLDALAGLPLAVEFRNVSWATDSVFAELQARRVTLVSVDEPDLPGLFPFLDVVTHADLFYVRFHGRNAQGWRSGKMQQQFDYHYSDDELQRWAAGPVARMAARARRGVIFFNNHVRGQAVGNARRLVEILRSVGQ